VPQAALNYDSGGYPDGDSELLLFVGELLPNSLSMMYGLHQERSRGEMTIVSPNPKTPLRISYNYLSDIEDLRRAREGVRLIVDVLRTRSFRMWCRELIDLDSNILNDDRTLDLWIHSHLATTVHAQGSAAMGPDCRTSAVVDHQLRVRGVENLRIVDTSVIPVPLHRGPSATAMVLGERAATMF
jgi:choline dehydrogenase-like flavoprotein